MNYMKTVIMLFLFKISSSKLLVPEREATSPISECLVYVINKYFSHSAKISFQFSEQQRLLISDVISRINSPILLNADDLHTNVGIDKRVPDDVRVILNEVDIQTFLNESKWTASTQFIEIVSNSSEEKMTNIFWEFWANNIVNVLLLVADRSQIHVYTFVPFNAHDCAIDKPVLLATWTRGQSLPEDFIEKERVTDLHGCVLNASVINLPPVVIIPDGTNSIEGVEGSVLNEIAKKLNFKLNSAEPKDGGGWGWVRPTPMGAVGEVFLKKSHFALGIFSYTLERYIDLDMSTPIGCGLECFSWAVPVGAKKAQLAWISLLITGFHNDLWYLIFTTIISIMITFRILSKIAIIDQSLFSGNIQTVFYTFKSSLGAAVDKVPKSSPLKLLFLTWLWYCFVIITAYQALLGSKLTVPLKKRNVNTFKDLLESDLRITGLKSSFRFIKDAEEEKDINAIGNLYEEVQYGFKEAIEKLIRHKNIAYMWTATTFMYNVMLEPEAQGLIHFMKQCVYEYYSVLILQKNCPFTRRVDQIIRGLSESGIICKWRKKYIYDVPQSDPGVQKLSLNRMIGSFVILGVGLCVALIFFLVEHIYYYYHHRPSMENRLTENILKDKITLNGKKFDEL